MKTGILLGILLISLSQIATANIRCDSIYSHEASSQSSQKDIAYYRSEEAPLLNAQQVAEIYSIKASQKSYFISRYEREVMNDYSWAQAGNPRLSGSEASLIVDMYRIQDHDMSREEIHQLLKENRSVPGKILFKHILFDTVR